MASSRLDTALVERGLVPSRARAQAAVASGRVRINGHVADKSSTPVEADATLVVESAPEFVSRGGEKLAGALADLASRRDRGTGTRSGSLDRRVHRLPAATRARPTSPRWTSATDSWPGH